MSGEALEKSEHGLAFRIGSVRSFASNAPASDRLSSTAAKGFNDTGTSYARASSGGPSAPQWPIEDIDAAQKH
jgi:hypothetical protein